MWLNRNVKWDQTLSRGPFHLYNFPPKTYEKTHTGQPRQLWQRIVTLLQYFSVGGGG